MSRVVKIRRITDGPPAVEVLEEAVHLLRGAPLSAYTAYVLGAVPWISGLLYFWAHMSWFAPGTGDRLAAALGLTLAFIGLKIAQAEFCARLYAHRAGAEPAAFTWRRARQLAAAQLRVQPWGFLLVPLSAPAIIPFGWTFAFYQNVAVLGATPSEPGKLVRESWQLAKMWPRQNHHLAGFVICFGLVVWLNLLTTAYALPWMANRFLGIENFFSMEGLSFFNTTFVAIVCALAWLLLDPLVKAIFVLRVFHGRSVATGDDLREEFARATAAEVTRESAGRSSAARRVKRAGVAATLLAGLLSLMLAGTAPELRAAEESPEISLEKPTAAATSAPSAAPAAPAVPEAPTRVASNDLDQALDATLRERDFQWSLRPLPGSETDDAEADDGFFNSIGQWIREQGRALDRAVERFVRWIEDALRTKKKYSPDPVPMPSGGGGWAAGGAIARLLIYVLLGLVLLALVWVIIAAIKQGRRSTGALAASAGSAPVTPDLRDESITAAQLPPDGWLALAHEQIAAGNWRLALRALYLASLARLADDGWISLAKHKTNLDYERELARRALAQTELVTGFRGHRRGFEDVWYGDTPAAEADVRAWLRELETAPPPAAAQPPPAA